MTDKLSSFTQNKRLAEIGTPPRNKITSHFRKLSSLKQTKKPTDVNTPLRNRITCYFQQPTSVTERVSFSQNCISNTVDTNTDDDCILIDETSPNTLKSNSELDIKAQISESVAINTNGNHKILNEDKCSENTTDKTVNDAVFKDSIDSTYNGIQTKYASFSHDDDEMLEAVLCLESKDEFIKKVDSKEFVDDTTQFFIDMVESFLADAEIHYLFNESEISILSSFSELPSGHHKKVIVRMYWLQWKWYKLSDIIAKYLNLNSTCNYVKNLITMIQDKGIFCKYEVMSLDDWFEVLLRSDLTRICHHFKLSTNRSEKPEMIKSVRKLCRSKTIFSNHTPGNDKTMEKKVMKMIEDNFGQCIKISNEAKSVFDRVHLIKYIGTNPTILREKKLNLLLMNIKNGKQSFPTADVSIDSVACIFSSREYFNEYVKSHNLYEQLCRLTTSPPYEHQDIINICRQSYQNYEELSKNKNLNECISSVWLHCFTPGYRYIKCMEIGINSYKALKTPEYLNEAVTTLKCMLSQTLYRQHKRALWYNEMALIFHLRLSNYEEAANTLITALNESDITYDAKAPLIERAKRLAGQKNICLPNVIRESLRCLTIAPKIDLPHKEIFARATDSNVPGQKSQYYFRDIITGDRTYSSVEQFALIHYINNTKYNAGEHWEGRIINSLFVLLFWDIIYSPVDTGKGIFFSYYQEAPLDIFTDQFYENRKDAIDSRLLDIESGWSTMNDILEFMQIIFTSRPSGEVSLFPDGIEWLTIVEIASCLGREGLLSICRRLSMMYHYAHSGFPDLTVWNAQTKEIKFVEVKGDGDKLSHKQIQWMTYLIGCGIETEVCYVHKGDNVKKLPKRKLSPKKTSDKRSPKKNGENNMLDNSLDYNDATEPKRNKGNNSDMSSQNSFDVLRKSVSPNKSDRSSGGSTPKKFKNSPNNSKSPRKNFNTSPATDSYLRSPTKFSKGGVGFFTSPTKDNTSPKKRSSLSLTRRRIFEKDT